MENEVNIQLTEIEKRAIDIWYEGYCAIAIDKKLYPINKIARRHEKHTIIKCWKLKKAGKSMHNIVNSHCDNNGRILRAFIHIFSGIESLIYLLSIPAPSQVMPEIVPDITGQIDALGARIDKKMQSLANRMEEIFYLKGSAVKSSELPFPEPIAVVPVNHYQSFKQKTVSAVRLLVDKYGYNTEIELRSYDVYIMLHDANVNVVSFEGSLKSMHTKGLVNFDPEKLTVTIIAQLPDNSHANQL